MKLVSSIDIFGWFTNNQTVKIRSQRHMQHIRLVKQWSITTSCTLIKTIDAFRVCHTSRINVAYDKDLCPSRVSTLEKTEIIANLFTQGKSSGYWKNQ